MELLEQLRPLFAMGVTLMEFLPSLLYSLQYTL